MLMNIQDLQSIYDLNIPTAIIVINNNGYLAIRHTQNRFWITNFMEHILNEIGYFRF